MIYAPIFEAFLPLCLALARPEAVNWVMPKLAVCVLCCRAGDQVVRWEGRRYWELGEDQMRVGSWRREDVEGWIEDRQDEDGRCV